MLKLSVVSTPSTNNHIHSLYRASKANAQMSPNQAPLPNAKPLQTNLLSGFASSTANAMNSTNDSKNKRFNLSGAIGDNDFVESQDDPA